MGLFDKIKEPIFLKEDSNAQNRLSDLEALRKEAAGELAERIEEEISKVSAGIAGEKAIHFELANSHIPMFVLHDLYLEHNGLSAQIDYLIVTRRHFFVLECKNLYGNIEINPAGDFIRTITYRGVTRREGVYSPVTQNRRHLDLIKEICKDCKNNIFAKIIFEKNFYKNYRSVVVLSNPKTLLYDGCAKKEIKEQVIRADQLVQYIRRVDAEPDSVAMKERTMKEMAQFFLDQHKPQNVDYTEKYEEALKVQKEEALKAQKEEHAEITQPDPSNENRDVAVCTDNQEKVVLCPKCGAPMVKRMATRGVNAGKPFYGCSRYPKCKEIVNI